MLFAAWMVGCGSADRAPGVAEAADPIPVAAFQSGASCEDGEEQACLFRYTTPDGRAACMDGVQRCVGGGLTRCVPPFPACERESLTTTLHGEGIALTVELGRLQSSPHLSWSGVSLAIDVDRDTFEVHLPASRAAFSLGELSVVALRVEGALTPGCNAVVALTVTLSTADGRNIVLTDG